MCVCVCVCVCVSSSTEHVETMMQLLTAVVKKFPLIVPEKSTCCPRFRPVSTVTNDEGARFPPSGP